MTLDPQQPQNLHAAIAATRSQISALSALEAQFTDLLNRMNAAAAAADAAEERARIAEQRLASLEAKIQVAQQVLSEAQLKMYEAVASVAGLLDGNATMAPAPAPVRPVAAPAPAASVPAAAVAVAVPVAVPEPAREVYRLTQFAHDLRVIAAESKTQGELLRRTKPLVQELVINKEWLRPEHFHIDEVQGFTATCLHEEPNHDLAIFAVAFAPGKGAPPHDHGTWAVVGVVEGEEQNTFWKRVDDGTRPGYAELKRAAVNTFRAGDVATFTPELIHSLDNVTDKVSLSLHVYGRHLNHASRSKFDPDASTVEPFHVRVAGSSNGAPAPAPVAAAAAAPQHAPSARPSRPLFRRPPAATPTIPPIITAPTRFDRFVQELRVIVAESKTEMEILRRAQPLVKEIAKSKEWLRPEHYHIDPVQGFTATCLHEEPNHDLGIFAVAFAPGKGAPPHDHGTWAVVSVVDGVEQNTMWKRVDDRSRPGYAEIRAVSVKNFQAEDCAIFTSDLIHSLDNLGDRVSLSFHVYGRHLNHAARFKFDANARTVEPFIVNVAN